MLQLNGGQRYSFGLFVTWIAIIALAIMITSCRDKQVDLPVPPPVIVKDTIVVKDTSTITVPVGGFKYLALGDSYTIGQGVPEEARFPMQVAAILSAKNITCKFQNLTKYFFWNVNIFRKSFINTDQ